MLTNKQLSNINNLLQKISLINGEFLEALYNANCVDPKVKDMIKVAISQLEVINHNCTETSNEIDNSMADDSIVSYLDNDVALQQLDNNLLNGDIGGTNDE